MNEEILLHTSTIHNDENKQFLIYQLKLMSIYIAIGFAISLVLPFPISLVGASAVQR